jgi:hypothetical protein
MAYGWLGTFRQGSWRSFRAFILQERRDVEARIAVIEAELARIGSIRVGYKRVVEGDEQTVTEERTGLWVTQGTSLEKLLLAYIAMGGNAFDISLFLTPDATVVFDNADGDEEGRGAQPGDGSVSPEDGVYTTGTEYRGAYLNIRKYVPARVGGRRSIEDSRAAGLVYQVRKPFNQALRYKRNDIEARILKLADLREQLSIELESLTLALAGEVAAIGSRDEDQFENVLGVAGIISAIDRVFYVVSDDGTADMESPNVDVLRVFPNLMPDITPDENNTAL